MDTDGDGQVRCRVFMPTPIALMPPTCIFVCTHSCDCSGNMCLPACLCADLHHPRALLSAAVCCCVCVACRAQVDKLEWLSKMLVRLGKAQADDIEEILEQFEVLDEDGSGSLDYEDIKRALARQEAEVGA